MRIDAYTKLLLTIICMCLVYLCLRDFLKVPRVHADAPIRVILVDGGNRAIAGARSNENGDALLVEIEQR